MEKNIHEYEIKLEKEWTKCLDDSFKKNNKKVKIDGFREGNAPKDLYLKKFGIESLYQDAYEKVVMVGYNKLLEDEKVKDLVPVVEPDIEIKDITPDAITIKYTIITKPEVKLGKYKDLGLEKEKAKVSKEEVTAEIEALREEYADLEDKDGALAEKDTAYIDYKGTLNGVAFEGGTAQNYPLVIGSKQFIPGFEEQLVGVKKGETVNINLTFPENYFSKDLAGKDVVFEVTVRSIKTRVLPELNADFFEDLGYEDVKTAEDLEKKVKEDLTKHKQNEIDDKFVDACLDKIAENSEMTLDDRIVDGEVHRMIHQFEDRLASQGMNIEMYYEFAKKTHEDLHKEMEPEAIKTLKYRYIIDAVSEKENIKTTDTEIDEHAEEIAKMYGITKEELIKEWGSLDMVKYDLVMRKTLDLIQKENEKKSK